MPKMTLINVGDIVTPRLKRGIKKLILWSDGGSPNDVVAEVNKDELLTVIRIENFATRKEFIQPEWSKSACLLLSEKGELGWTGTGWLRRVITTAP